MRLIISENGISPSKLKEDNPGYYIETAILEYHINAVDCRSREQFLGRLALGTSTVKLPRDGKSAYKAALKALTDNHGDNWLLNDARVLWFYDEFAGLIDGTIEVVAIES